MRYAVCLEFFWKELPFPERIARARAAGFDAGEIWGWRGRDLDAIARAAEEHHFRIVSLSGMEPSPGFNDRRSHAALTAEIEGALDAAERLHCQQVIVLGGTTVGGVSRDEQLAAIADGLRPLAARAHARGMWLALEILNSRRSFPGYFLDNTDDQFTVIEAVDHPGLRAVYDLFHAGIMEGDHTTRLTRHADRVASLQVAGVPHRNEPFLGELHHRPILDALDRNGFRGWTTFEYIPTLDSDASLAATMEWLGR